MSAAENNAGIAALAGRWALPVIETNSDGIMRMHLSIAVSGTDDLSTATVGCQAVAGGQNLTLSQATGAGQLVYLQTLATTAVAQFVFDNPGNPAIESITANIGDDTQTWSFGSSLPVA